MALPLFSEMLSERRRQLGLPISQVSSVLRLKEDVLIAFEQGDFDGIPKSGYAQGMLSSYARYLGLNAKDVVEQFSADLYEHNVAVERSGGSQGTRRAAGAVSEAYPSGSRRTTVESRGLLPTSGGFAGDMGDFATTSRPRPRSEGLGSSNYDDYAGTQPYEYEEHGYELSPTPLGQVRPRTATNPRSANRSADSRQGKSTRKRRSRRDDASSSRRRQGKRPDSRRTRSSSTRERGSNRQPVRSSNRQRSRSGRQLTGWRRVALSVLENPRALMAIVAIPICIVLLIVLISALRGCAAGQEDSTRTVTVSSQSEEDTTGQKKSKTSTTNEDDQTRAEAAAKATEKETLAAERQISVTVEENTVPWVEIECDGKSEIADQVTGPWNKTFKVTKSMTISVDDPAAVQVTENGKPLEFESKSSGVGTITVEAAGKDDEDEKKDSTESDDSSDSEQQDEGSQDQTQDESDDLSDDQNPYGEDDAYTDEQSY